jgi:Holliday junction resolvase
LTNGSIYERELKGLLEARGQVVIRSAGSLAVDLVAINPKNGDAMLIEVKSYQGNAFYISKSKEMREQWAEMCRLESMCNGHTGVFYALRMKGQTDYKLVRPSRLESPYHWNQAGIEAITVSKGGEKIA